MNEIFSFTYRYREQKLKKFNLDHRVPQLAQEYTNLPQRRQEFAVFCRDEGLSSITAVEQYDQKKEEMAQKIKASSIRDAIDFLGQLRRKALLGRRLTHETNIYLRAKEKSSKVPEQLTDQELRGLGDQVEIPSPWGAVENRARTLREHEDDVHPLVVERSGQKGMYPQEEASFALHREALIVQDLESSLTKEFHSGISERLGLNHFQYNILLRQTGSIDGLIKRFTVIPEAMADWKQKGLMQFDVDFNRYNRNLFGPVREPWLAEKAVTMLLPDGVQNEKYKKFLKDRSLRSFDDEDKDPGKSWHNLRKEMYHNLVVGFSEADTLGHPLLEDRARKLAVYVLSATNQPVNEARESAAQFWRSSDRPLVESVGILKRLAYEEGLEQRPLLEKMSEKISEEGVNPQEIANRLQHLNEIVKSKRLYDNLYLWDLGDTYESDWFAKETFCKVSTLDNEGKYAKISLSSFSLKVVKSPEAAQEIIDGLRDMPQVKN